MNTNQWNSLEVAKLIAQVLTPLALAILGLYINRVSKRFDDLQWRSQKLIEKRLAIYDDLAPQLNDLLCYFTYVGGWKEMAPPDVIALKRALDKKIHLAAPLFSETFFQACMTFLNLCFETYTGWGQDARLRTQFERRQQTWQGEWKDEWSTCFSIVPANPQEVRDAYTAVMSVFAADIGVQQKSAIPRSGEIPGNIR